MIREKLNVVELLELTDLTDISYRSNGIRDTIWNGIRVGQHFKKKRVDRGKYSYILCVKIGNESYAELTWMGNTYFTMGTYWWALL